MGEGACMERIIVVRNYITNTIMEKNKQRGKKVGLRIMNFQG